MDLGRYGVWSPALRLGEEDVAVDAARRLEELGFGTIWLPGLGGAVFDRVRALLAGTERVKVATGIVSIWSATPADVAQTARALAEEFPGRFLLGLGVSHAPLVDRKEPGRYTKPYTRMVEYLDELDALPDSVGADERILAANHPRMLRLAAERSLGSHTYLVPPAHTREARAVLGQGRLLAPEQSVLLETDPERAREAARNHLGLYLGFPNYTSNWLAHGLTEDDLRDGGSDRLVDAIVGWGDVDRVAERLRAHHDAGADHVCIQLVNDDREQPFSGDWPRLAAALLD